MPAPRRSGSKAQFTPKQYDAKNPASRGLDIIFGCTRSLLRCEARLNQEYKSVNQLSQVSGGRAGRRRRRIDQDVIKLRPQFSHPGAQPAGPQHLIRILSSRGRSCGHQPEALSIKRPGETHNRTVVENGPCQPSTVVDMEVTVQ